ncbi:hypothetical protein, partial [Burkholderia pseudomallei]|uniref:hypothetical protein n=1 Tax=Burkholderia pseudomallei TaxID=28450 RepID=UPI001C4C944E
MRKRIRGVAWCGALHALAREAPAAADGRCGWDTERGRRGGARCAGPPPERLFEAAGQELSQALALRGAEHVGGRAFFL